MKISFSNQVMIVDGSFLQASGSLPDHLREVLEEAESQILGLLRRNVSGVSYGKVIFVMRLTPNTRAGLRSEPDGRLVYRDIMDLLPRFHSYWMAAVLPSLMPNAQIVAGVPGLNGLCLTVRALP